MRESPSRSRRRMLDRRIRCRCEDSAASVGSDLLDRRGGCRRTPEFDLDRPEGGETEKNIFGRSPAIGAFGGAFWSSRSDVVGTFASSIATLSARSMPTGRKTRKAAPQLGFRAFTTMHKRFSYGRSDVWTSSVKSTLYASLAWPGRGSEGAPRRFGNLLFPLRNLLTRACDSNSFCAGVTNK
jgi:hypothetical protein